MNSDLETWYTNFNVLEYYMSREKECENKSYSQEREGFFKKLSEQMFTLYSKDCSSSEFTDQTLFAIYISYHIFHVSNKSQHPLVNFLKVWNIDIDDIDDVSLYGLFIEKLNSKENYNKIIALCEKNGIDLAQLKNATSNADDQQNAEDIQGIGSLLEFLKNLLMRNPSPPLLELDSDQSDQKFSENEKEVIFGNTLLELLPFIRGIYNEVFKHYVLARLSADEQEKKSKVTQGIDKIEKIIQYGEKLWETHGRPENKVRKYGFKLLGGFLCFTSFATCSTLAVAMSTCIFASAASEGLGFLRAATEGSWERLYAILGGVDTATTLDVVLASFGTVIVGIVLIVAFSSLNSTISNFFDYQSNASKVAYISFVRKNFELAETIESINDIE